MTEAVKERFSSKQTQDKKENKSENKESQSRLSALNAFHHELILGIPAPQDRKVIYNPKPTEQFYLVSEEIGRLLEGLLSRTVSIKSVAGPVGIVHMVQSSSMVSIKEALFWIGAISLNLGMLNLLPIPLLDGGTILFSFFEMVTGRRIHPKTMEKVIVLFAILLVSFFLFVTYNDVVNIFGNIW
jgi:regulator of sigma E protease